MLTVHTNVTETLWFTDAGRRLNSSRFAPGVENVAYRCTRSTPCFRRDGGTYSDHVAFFTAAQRAFVLFDMDKGEVAAENGVLYVSVTNYDVSAGVSTVAGRSRCSGRGDDSDKEQCFFPAPVLTGVLVMSGVEAGDVGGVCGGVVEGEGDAVQCTGHGKCEEGGCVCGEGWGGRFCETELVRLPGRNDGKGGDAKVEKEMWKLGEPIEDGYDFSLKGYAERVFVYVPTRNVGLHVRVKFLKAFHTDTKYNTLNQTRVMYIVTKREGVNRGGYLEKGTMLPTKIDSQTLFMLTEGGITYAVAYRDETVANGTRVFVSVITAAPGKEPEEIESAAFSVKVEECMAKGQSGLKASDGKSDLAECPNYHASPFPFAVLPVTLVIISLITVTIIVLFILDRQHGFTNKVDKLSAAEVSRMYPAVKYARGRQLAGANAECSICLCAFESADQVRNLQCDHVYHTDCVDVSFLFFFSFFFAFAFTVVTDIKQPWLTENRASCPTCRADVRLEHLSDRRFMRRLVRFVIGPLRARLRWRRVSDVSDTGTTSPSASQSDLETGPSSTSQPSSPPVRPR